MEKSVRENPRNLQKVVLKMEKKGGVYYVPVEINGERLSFIFDTGASAVSISQKEAYFLYQNNKLLPEDILGEAQFSDANGDISEGTVINLKIVKIGNRELKNVQASVVHNQQAPLLLGQTVMERFGKFSMDFRKNTITFEWKCWKSKPANLYH